MGTNIGGRLTEMRHEMRLTQKQIADKTGIGLRTWQNIERGENVPSGDTLLRIADLGWNPGWILTGIGPQMLHGQSESAGEDMKERSAASAAVQPDVEALAAVVRLVEDWLVANRRSMTPAKKGETIAAIYQFVMEDAAIGESQVDSRKVTQFLRLVA